MVKQFERIYVLLDMVNEKLHYYEQDKEDYPYATKTTKEEVKRNMLVLRQEMIRLHKMLGDD